MEVLVKKPGIQYLPKKIVQKKSSISWKHSDIICEGGAYLNS